MNIKDLQHCSRIRGELACIEEQLKTMESKLYYAKPPKLDGMPHSGTTTDGADMLASYIDLKDSYSKLYIQLVNESIEAEKALDGLNTIERQAVRYRYIMGLTVAETAEKLSYSERQTYRILSAAVDKICQ